MGSLFWGITSNYSSGYKYEYHIGGSYGMHYDMTGAIDGNYPLYITTK